MSNIINLQTPFIYRIIVPEIHGQYDFREGNKLAELHITDTLINDFCEDRLNIDVIFPDNLEQYEAGKPPKILGEFFVGLMGKTIKKFRDLHFSQTKHDLKRRQIHDVNEEADANGIFNQIIGASWHAYEDVEDALNKKTRLGIKLSSGEIDYEETSHAFLTHCANKFRKGCDVLFMTDFAILDQLKPKP